MAVTPAAEERLPHAWGTPDYEQQSDSYRLGWLAEVVQEGDRINKDDPAAERADLAMSYVLGEQPIAGSERGRRPSYLPDVIVNETKRNIRRHASALTDVKPVWGYRTFNPDWQSHAQLLNWLTVAWWTNTFADLALADVIKYAAVAGTGDCVFEYDPGFGAGELVLGARDFRDTLPYRPGRSPSIQQWRGAVLREAHPVATLRAHYPDKAHLLREDGTAAGWGRGVFTKWRQAIRKIVQPAGGIFDWLAKTPHTGRPTAGEVTLYRAFLHDPSVNLSNKAIIMGPPGSPWSYTVHPGERLYPRRRLLVSTERTLLYDGPNTYWHGMIPAARLRLDPWPWNFLGLSLVHDQMPTQDAVNRMVNTFLNVFEQWAHRGIVADNAIPQSTVERLDTRKPGWKARIPGLLGKGIEVIPGPELPPWAFEFLQWTIEKHAEQSGTANLDVLQQLRQMPSEATIQKFFEALTPELRLEGRYVELFLRELADQAKSNFFQFYPAGRRVQMLGDLGLTLRDFDFAPGTAVPSMQAGESGYLPELDAGRDEAARTAYFTKLFTFFMQPNSVLALNSQEEQIKYLTFARMGLLDAWTLAEKFDIANYGEPPVLPLPPMEPVDPVAALADPGRYLLDPMSGQILELRKPTTVIEKLMAQQILGIGMAVGPAGASAGSGAAGGAGGARPGAGRKAAGEAPGKAETKRNEDGTPRPTVTESAQS